MSKYTRGLLAVILAVVLVLPAAAFAMLPEANARSSTGMDGPAVSGTVVDPDTSGRWEKWAAGHSGNKVRLKTSVESGPTRRSWQPRETKSRTS